MSVSAISSYYLCPRLAFFRNGRKEVVTDAGVRAGVFRSVSYSLYGVLSSPQPEVALSIAISDVCQDSLCIYGTAFTGAISSAGDEIRARSSDILAGLFSEKERLGEERLLRILEPSSVSMAIYSEKLRISGSIDKVVNIDGAPVPIVISASMPPLNGIYTADRVRLAAYAMLLSEKYAIDCNRGGIEYFPGWCLRMAEVRHEDKRKALYARNRVLDIREGRMPDASRGKWCEKCAYANSCNVRVTFLDSLFKK